MHFPYPPISLPADDSGRLCAAENATRAHYTTLVLVADDNNSPAILEFSESVLSGLAAYAKRHGDLSTIEILVSRDDDGKIRLRVGKTTDSDDVQILAAAYADVYEGLYAKYISKIGRKLDDL